MPIRTKIRATKTTHPDRTSSSSDGDFVDASFLSAGSTGYRFLASGIFGVSNPILSFNNAAR
ncbi:MAG: hypothetical protein OXP71_01860 [Candidatus Poribacteria bacterium]|nr:hypothetical protein [Candidatus Poribacteria bacterium]